VDESETFSDLTKTEIWRMKEDDLHLSCEERKLRAVQYSMNVDTMRRVLRFYEGIEDRNEMTMLENVEEESDERLEEICSSNQLRDPISKCKLSVLGLRFRSSLEKAVERFLKLRLSEDDISKMSEAELRAALRKRGLLESGLDEKEMRKELESYECWSEISKTNFGYERCLRDSVLDRLNGDEDSERRFQGLEVRLRTNDDV
jgi:hypothetical protein